MVDDELAGGVNGLMEACSGCWTGCGVFGELIACRLDFRWCPGRTSSLTPPVDAASGRLEDNVVVVFIEISVEFSSESESSNDSALFAG